MLHYSDSSAPIKIFSEIVKKLKKQSNIYGFNNVEGTTKMLYKFSTPVS
jgi:hypothetical protein